MKPSWIARGSCSKVISGGGAEGLKRRVSEAPARRNSYRSVANIPVLLIMHSDNFGAAIGTLVVLNGIFNA